MGLTYKDRNGPRRQTLFRQGSGESFGLYETRLDVGRLPVRQRNRLVAEIGQHAQVRPVCEPPVHMKTGIAKHLITCCIACQIIKAGDECLMAQAQQFPVEGKPRGMFAAQPAVPVQPAAREGLGIVGVRRRSSAW